MPRLPQWRDIHTPKRDVKAGDLAYLSAQDEQSLVQQNTLSATRKYPTVISFTEGDTLDEEARVQFPRPPMPSVNRARGRIGFDYMELSSAEPRAARTPAWAWSRASIWRALAAPIGMPAGTGAET